MARRTGEKRARYLTRRERRAAWTVAIVGAVAIAVFAAVALFGVGRLSMADLFSDPGPTAPSASPTPRTDADLFVAPDSHAATAATSDDRFAELAAIPQFRWLTGFSTVETAETDVQRYVDAAAAAGAIPMLALYQIPGRDCGLYAAGGLDDDREYLAWIDAVARGLADHPEAIVIVEPDALAMADDCVDEDGRLALLGDAVDRLAATGATVYLDAGHSGWIPADEMAERLVKAGVGSIRGFSTNVSNFRPTEDEVGYAERVRARLAELGVADAHYVIDTSRNGAKVKNGDVCNPLSARTGVEPQLFTGSALDAYLWVKPPGEPDGPCNGAQAGQKFWPEGALRLLGQADEEATG